MNDFRYTRRTLAERMGISTRAIQRWEYEGLRHGRIKLKRTVIGGRVYFKQKDVDTFLKQVEQDTERAIRRTEKRRVAANRATANG